MKNVQQPLSPNYLFITLLHYPERNKFNKNVIKSNIYTATQNRTQTIKSITTLNYVLRIEINNGILKFIKTNQKHYLYDKSDGAIAAAISAETVRMPDR